jgi:hypothetical protein
MTTIRVEWGDLKPKRCMNKKCNTSFTKYPDSMVVQHPTTSKSETNTEKLLDKSTEKEALVTELSKAAAKRGKKSESQDD